MRVTCPRCYVVAALALAALAALPLVGCPPQPPQGASPTEPSLPSPPTTISNETVAEAGQPAPVSEAAPTANREETAPSPGSKADKIVWVESYAKGMEQAKKAGKPMMIDLYADWCGPCRMLDEQVWTDARVIEAATKYVCVKVNVDKDAATADKYKATAIPLVVFAHSDGTVMNRSVGLVPADKMLALMKNTSGK
ncbi:thioredoxin family protein [bacterium]|nr:thioredoxin family protein [bacterium]